jgi:Flp pilus assembly pilin Flp
MLQRIRQTIRDDKGIAALEYALIAGLIFSAILNASLALSPKLKSAYSNLGTSLTKHAAGT